MNEENKANREFLVNEGSAESAANKGLQVLTEPADAMVVMEQKVRQEKEVLRAFLAEMVKTAKTDP